MINGGGCGDKWEPPGSFKFIFFLSATGLECYAEVLQFQPELIFTKLMKMLTSTSGWS